MKESKKSCATGCGNCHNCQRGQKRPLAPASFLLRSFGTRDFGEAVLWSLLIDLRRGGIRITR